MSALRSIACLLVLVLPLSALAHGTMPGIGGAYAAFAHTITEPPATLALLGLGLLFGIHGTERFGRAWPAFLAAMVASIAAMLAHWRYIDPELPLNLIALLAGSFSSSGLPLPRATGWGLGLIAGYFLGVFATPGPASWSTTAYSIVGAVLGVNLTLIFIATAINKALRRFQQPWIMIGFRVVGSWIAAIAVLMLALSIR